MISFFAPYYYLIDFSIEELTGIEDQVPSKGTEALKEMDKFIDNFFNLSSKRVGLWGWIMRTCYFIWGYYLVTIRDTENINPQKSHRISSHIQDLPKGSKISLWYILNTKL